MNAANDGKAIHDQLLQENCIALPMKRNNADGGHYYVSVKINTIVEPMIMSTVSHNIFDINFAKLSSVEYKATGGENYGGPTGTEGKICINTKPVAIKIGDAPFELPVVHVLNTHAYEGISRPKHLSNITGGMLGCDFLLAHGAVVDFGNGILYLKKTE